MTDSEMKQPIIFFGEDDDQHQNNIKRVNEVNYMLDKSLNYNEYEKHRHMLYKNEMEIIRMKMSIESLTKNLISMEQYLKCLNEYDKILRMTDENKVLEIPPLHQPFFYNYENN